MGQKIHPKGLRLGIIRTWDGRWFAPRARYTEYLHEDIRLRRFLKEKLSHAAVARVEIERTPQRVRLNIHTARPGAVIGKKGEFVNQLRKDLAGLTDKMVDINIHEIRNPAIDAQMVAESVAGQLVRRVSFRRAMKKAVSDARRAGAQGVRVQVAGRLGGAEIARTEWYRDGRVPLHTLRADVDYGFAEAYTTHGVIGVKAWVFTQEILPEGMTIVRGRIMAAPRPEQAAPVAAQVPAAAQAPAAEAPAEVA